MKDRTRLLIAILIVLIIAAIVLAVTTGGREENADRENLTDIADSSIHGDLPVGLVLPDGPVEEITEETTTREIPEGIGTHAEVKELDLWDMGLEWYGISYEDTNRTLKLITYEGYGYSRLSYYVACCCWVRATEGYWGYSNLYSAFGEADTSYGTWMDSLGIADWAYDALRECYMNPTYVRYCNGMATPSSYIYAEYAGGNWIYVWN